MSKKNMNTNVDESKNGSTTEETLPRGKKAKKVY